MTPRSVQVEHRRSRRVPLRVAVEYTHVDTFLDDYSANLSLGGMFLATEQLFEVGTTFQLGIHIPDHDHVVRTRGVVVWVVPGTEGQTRGLGIAFDPLKPRDRRMVERLLQTALADTP